MTQCKQCARCRETKPVAAFSRNRSRADGLCHYCRACKAEAAAQRAVARPDDIRAASRRYYAENRDQVVARTRAYRQANYEAVLRGARDSRRRARAANPDRLRAQFNAWRLANLERMREHDRRRYASVKRGCAVYPFTTEQLAAKVAYWGHRCWICRGPFEAIDHVKPLAKLGPHMLANLRPICTACNTRKRDRWPFIS